MNKKLKLLVQQEIRNAIRNQSLAELAQIAERFAKNGKLLKEEDGGILPSQKDAENIQIMAGDVKKIRGILTTLYKDAIDAQKENETPSAYMDAYVKLLLTMLPITIRCLISMRQHIRCDDGYISIRHYSLDTYREYLL